MIASTLLMAITALSYPGMCKHPAVDAEDVDCMDGQELEEKVENYHDFYERNAELTTPVEKERIRDWVICETDEMTLQRGESARAPVRINWSAAYLPVVTVPGASQKALAPLRTDHLIQTPELGSGEAPLMCMKYAGGGGVGVKVNDDPEEWERIDTSFYAYLQVDVHTSELAPGVHNLKLNVRASDPEWRSFHTIQCDLKVTVEGDDANDLDGDGVENSKDQCPNTCATSDIIDENGCDLAQLCPCSNNWCDNGSYVQCVREETRKLRRAKKITRAKRRKLMRQARRSECGEQEFGNDFDDPANCETGFDFEDDWGWDNWEDWNNWGDLFSGWN